MVVCKFFQQGNCRYGQNCRFDHIYGSKYSYHAGGPQTSQPAQAPAGVTDDQLVNQVLLDVQGALKGGQWILSCYSPYKEKPNFPGITDLSMEEARLFIYEAKANNNLDQAVAYMNNLFKESTHKYEQLLLATPPIVKVLRSLYKGEIVPSPFTNTTQNGLGGNVGASSVFRSAVQGSSIFGQNSSNTSPSIFNQSPGFGQSTNQTPSVFGSPTSPENAKSIFAQASQNVFGASQAPNAFPTSPDTGAKSIFAQATQNVFGQPANPASIFGEATQTAFGKPNDPFQQQKDVFSQQKDPFGQPSGPFNQQGDVFSQAKDPFSQPSNPFTQQNNPFAPASAQNGHQMSERQDNNGNIYSDINDLTPEHMDAFKDNDFKLGFIPEVPPPSSLCF